MYPPNVDILKDLFPHLSDSDEMSHVEMISIELFKCFQKFELEKNKQMILLGKRDKRRAKTGHHVILLYLPK